MDESTTPGASAAESGDDLLRTLALALLAGRFSMEIGQDRELLVGTLPPNLPFVLPLPDGAQLLGSYVTSEPTVVFETALAPDAVLDFYRGQLLPMGWSIEDPFGHSQCGGFVHTMLHGDRRGMTFFQHGPEGPSLNVACLSAPNQPITVHVDWRPEGIMRGRRLPSRIRREDPMSVLPPIYPPDGARQQGGGGGSSGDQVYTHGTVESHLDIPALAAHYRGQLERAGWQAGESGESGPVAWSAWTFTDDEGEPWRAMFVALQQVGQAGRYHLWLSADYTGASIGGSPGRLIGSQTHVTG
jgi:hypothetical protein